ncbi:ABC transporter permease [Actinokineospora fastidiosa]|uniref:ABC transporter permease n=1 Tax=Actinokineospora fastidiosa TaxID=1816 RepID=A0A918G661_9PSEU|nr:ABC transporter permease [Actinokineospora fastidiosa]GGS19588.1 ABC transporter permease [Actinokineospora fastidiosa]
MTLLAVERLKLFTTRSPWWSMLAALVVTIGFAALMAGTSDDTAPMDLAATQFGYNFGVVVVMVMAALAVTTEYRFSTIRATFLAVPNRTAALLAKTAVVATLGALIGAVAAFGSWGIATLITPEADLALDSPYAWRAVAGVALVYFFSAVIAVAVGTFIRHSAGAISALLIYSQLVESLVQLIPNVGDDIYKWLPFNVANNFVTGDPDPSARPVEFGPPPSTAELSPWWSLAYFAGFALVLLILSIVSANKRDA